MSTLTHALSREAEAARVLLLNLRDVLATDEDAIEDAIEGQTSFKEVAAKAIARLAEIDALTEAIKTQAANLRERSSRLDVQADNIRASLLSALAAAELTKLELPQATLSRKRTPPKAIVTDESVIPTRFLKRADPQLDRRELLAALKAGDTIDGAELSNGGETVDIRWR